jgi:hypothetical protein
MFPAQHPVSPSASPRLSDIPSPNQIAIVEADPVLRSSLPSDSFLVIQDLLQPISPHAITRNSRHPWGVPLGFEPPNRRASGSTQTLPFFSTATKYATRTNSRNLNWLIRLLHNFRTLPGWVSLLAARHSPLFLRTRPGPAAAPPPDAPPKSSTDDPSRPPNPCSQTRFFQTAPPATHLAAQACRPSRRKIPAAD